MKVNFTGVEAPKQTNTTERVVKVIEPGVQELKIVDIQEGSAQTGTAFVAVTLNKQENPVEYPLVERFYLSPKSLWRLQHFLGEVLQRDLNNTEVDIAELKPQLLNKVNTYVVNGEEVLKQSGDKVYTNVRANLAFSNFINPPAGTTHYIKKLNQDSAGNSAAVAGKADDDDLPF